MDFWLYFITWDIGVMCGVAFCAWMVYESDNYHKERKKDKK